MVGPLPTDGKGLPCRGTEYTHQNNGTEASLPKSRGPCVTSFFSPASVDSSGSSGKRSSISGVRDATSAELVSPSIVSEVASLSIGVREGILLGGRKKFSLKITICLESNFFSLIRMGPETSCKSDLYS